MRPSRTGIGFFIFGAAVFAYLIYRFGVDQIVRNVERAGWSLVYVFCVWFLIYIANALAWKLLLDSNGKKMSFVRLFMVTVSGFVINYITPVIALGGEPYKINALSDSLGTSRSVSAVVLYRMVHLLGHMFLLLTGIIAALIFLGFPIAVQMILLVAGVLIAGIIFLTLAGHRNGVFQNIHGFVNRMPLLRKAAPSLSRYRENLEEMDEVITDVYHHARRKLYAAIGLEYLSRVLMGVEVYLILRGIGIDTTIVSALFLYVSYSIVINLLFFIPLNLGAREGGLALGLGTLALPPLLGVYLGVVMRVREFFWIALGLLFILFTNKQKPSGVPQTVHNH
ncbi:MAG TPA: lysylphosphatidylglycerol synthase transmembrane domain-containing protein [Bacteroidota bacterium]|nr:lysylphosphatidylglycerol synthase transmembrane domain-containing protein [Bacteroidota bacterium]